MKDIREYEVMGKLDLPENERRWVSDRADMLIDSFTKLANINTSGVEPLITVLDIKNVLREDVSVKMLPREELLSNAPEQYDGYFKVPKTLD
jgi:aspartyl-tRNA(Asn)/glutamyl-tRNA(Gln) amidotransferase subunit C